MARASRPEGRRGAAGRTADGAAAGPPLRQSSKVYDELRRDITGCRLRRGTPLQEAALSERYGASRTPVREALLRLQEEGFVERIGRRLVVKEFSFAEVQELYEMREALEKMAVRLCIERASDRDLDELERQLDAYHDFDPVTDYAAFNEHANRFHRSIAALSGNAMIQKELEAVHDKVLAVNVRYWGQGDMRDEARRGHLTILQALRDRDILVAEAAVRVHIRGVIKLYRQHNRPDGGAA